MKSLTLRNLLHYGPTLAKGFLDYHVVSRIRPLHPALLMFAVNYRCDTKCVMCNIWKSKKEPELPPAEVARILADPLFKKVEFLLVTGGEATLRHDLPEVYRVFLDGLPRLKKIQMPTTGASPKRVLKVVPELADLCRARGVDFNLGVSLDGLGGMHDAMRGIEGTFASVEETLEGLKALAPAHGFHFGVQFTITRRNLRDAPRVRAWARERGIESLFIYAGFHDTYLGNADRRPDLDLGGSETDDRAFLVAFMRELAGERALNNFAAYYWSDMASRLERGTSRTTPCPFQLEGVFLDPYGNLHYCASEGKIGNVRERGAGEIYFDPKNLGYRRQMWEKACPGCESNCMTHMAIAKNLVRYAGFLLAASGNGKAPR